MQPSSFPGRLDWHGVKADARPEDLAVNRFALLLLILMAAAAWTKPPVPLYASHVTKTHAIAPGQTVVVTSDSVDVVSAWYRKNLADLQSEKTRPDGGHLFFTHNGATVSVQAGNRFEPGTQIGLVWDATKYGTF